MPTGFTGFNGTWGPGQSNGGGGQTSTYNNTSTTVPVSGPNGPFSTLGPQLSSNATNIMNSGNTVMNTAMDPQNQLYSMLQNQQQQQGAQSNAAAGLGSSPWGASVANNAMNNFNINWQNQQLSRQAQGLSAAEGAMGPATSLYNGQYGSTTTGSGSSTSPQQNQSGGGGGGTRMSGGGVAQQDPTWNMPAFTGTGQTTDPTGNFVGQPTVPQSQGYTGDPNMLTQQGQDYNQIIGNDPMQNPVDYGNNGGGNYQLQPPPVDYNNMINPSPQDSVVQDNSWQQITNTQQAIDYLANWS